MADNLKELLLSGTSGQVLIRDDSAPEGVSWQSPQPADWNGITNKPAAYTATSHNHPISEVTNLQNTLDAKATSSHTHAPTYALLANGATAMQLATTNTVKVTPTANATYTTTVPVAGTYCSTIILTSGNTSRTITFGTGFKPTATLVTGTTAARVFVLGWISDGVNLYEVSRTLAMVA